MAKSERRVPPAPPKPHGQVPSKGEEEGEEPTHEYEDLPKELYVTLAEFSATAGDGLSFKAGETVTVVTKNQSGWWYVEMKNKEGWVPSSYLEKKATPPAPPPPSSSDSAAPKVITKVTSKPEVVAKKPEAFQKKPEVTITSSSPPTTSPSHSTVSKSQSFDGDLTTPTTPGALTKPKVASKTPSPVRHNVPSLKKTHSTEDLLDTADSKRPSIRKVADPKADVAQKPSIPAKRDLKRSATEDDIIAAATPPTALKPVIDAPRPVPRKPVVPEPSDPEPHTPKPFNIATSIALQQSELDKALKKRPLAKVVSADVASHAQKPPDAQPVKSASMVKQDTKQDTKQDIKDARRPPPRPESSVAEKVPPKRPNPPSVQKNKAPPPRPTNSPAMARKPTYTTICDYEEGLEGCVQFREGEEVTEVVEKKEDGWWFIRIGTREGWAPSTFLDEIKSPSSKAKSAPVRPDAAPVRPDATPVRPAKKPSLKSTNLFKAIENYCTSSIDDSGTCIDLVKGMVYEVVERADGWWFVRGTDNKEGWVPSTYLDPS